MEGSILTGIPYNWEEGIIILLIVFILFLMVIIISERKKIGLGKEFIIALAKGGSQLFVIAVFLTYLFRFDLWYIPIWFLLLTMILVGGYTSAKRASHMPHSFQVTTPAILGGSTLVLIVLAVSRAMPLNPQFIVPLAGMSFGNSMVICSLTLERFLREIKVNRPVIETALSLGATSQKAIEEYGRLSIRASLIPTIDHLKTLGIIFIPGAMSGLLIAGTNPLVAAEYQIIVFLMIIGGGVVASLLTLFLAHQRVFTESEQIAEWISTSPF
jgi:putative ABC transport system permease protein